jgi:hypothetical protein
MIASEAAVSIAPETCVAQEEQRQSGIDVARLPISRGTGRVARGRSAAAAGAEESGNRRRAGGCVWLLDTKSGRLVTAARGIALRARAVVTADANSSLPELVRCARSGASSETAAVSAWDGGFRRRGSVQPQIGAVSLIDGRGEGRQPARGPRQVVIVRIRLDPAARRRSAPERFLSVGWQVDRGV